MANVPFADIGEVCTTEDMSRGAKAYPARKVWYSLSARSWLKNVMLLLTWSWPNGVAVPVNPDLNE